jgi:uncharacterized protein (DUF2267 family)
VQREIFYERNRFGCIRSHNSKDEPLAAVSGEELGLDSKQEAYHLLRVVLHELRDRLPMPQTAHLGAQLPTLLRRVYYDDWSPSLKSSKEHREEFLSNIAAEIDPALNLYGEAVAKCVFRVISEKWTQEKSHR